MNILPRSDKRITTDEGSNLRSGPHIMLDLAYFGVGVNAGNYAFPHQYTTQTVADKPIVLMDDFLQIA
jgi:hypothetical protein